MVAKMSFKQLLNKPIAAYLEEARRLGASDLHFQVDSPPSCGCTATSSYLDHPNLEPEYTEPRIRDLFGEYERDVFEKHNDVDFALRGHGPPIPPRTSLRQRKGRRRGLPHHSGPHPDARGACISREVLRRFTTYRQGIVLVTGPAGCGKSSTQAALIDIINQEQHDHIVVCEDPIEYVFTSKNCNGPAPTSGSIPRTRDGPPFGHAIDPDYICVGEVREPGDDPHGDHRGRDGHLVFAPLHTTNAIRSVDRIIDVYPPKSRKQIRSMVSESMQGSSAAS